MGVHTIHAPLLQRQVRVVVVGCGGAGSALTSGLPYLHQSLIVRGHPGGLHVTVLDGEKIAATNCVRQPFSKSEIGLYKSVVLVNRLNVFWELDWEAVPEHLTENQPLTRVDIVIGCVDTRAARAAIQSCVTRSSSVGYWLDIGNNANNGQFILGEPLNYENRRTGNRLRTVADLYPEVTNTELEEDSLPSCSAAEALDRQEPFVNATLANHSLSLLAHLFRYGTIEHHGGFVNLATGHTMPLRIDPATWRRIQKRRRNNAAAMSRSPVGKETVSPTGRRSGRLLRQ